MDIVTAITIFTEA